MIGFNYRLRRQEKGETEALRSASRSPAESAAEARLMPRNAAKVKSKYIFLSRSGQKTCILEPFYAVDMALCWTRDEFTPNGSLKITVRDCRLPGWPGNWIETGVDCHAILPK